MILFSLVLKATQITFLKKLNLSSLFQTLFIITFIGKGIIRLQQNKKCACRIKGWMDQIIHFTFSASGQCNDQYVNSGTMADCSRTLVQIKFSAHVEPKRT